MDGPEHPAVGAGLGVVADHRHRVAFDAVDALDDRATGFARVVQRDQVASPHPARAHDEQPVAGHEGRTHALALHDDPNEKRRHRR